MPRAVFMFRLPQERGELAAFQEGPAALSSLAAVVRVLRDHEKHGKPTAATRKLVAQLREEIDFKALDRADF